MEQQERKQTTKKILIICALAGELQSAKKCYKKKRPENTQVDFFVSGIGNIHTALVLSEKLALENYDFVVNYGVCGYKDTKERIIQVARSYYLPVKKEICVPVFFEFAKISSIACSEVPVFDPEIIQEENYVDMESYAIEKVCEHFRVPRIILKVPVDKIWYETKNFNIKNAQKLLDEHINFEKLFLMIEKYLEKLPQKSHNKTYYSSHRFTVSEKVILEKYIAKYESLSGENYENFLQKHKSLEKKSFLSTLWETLDTLSKLW